jgi:hypothetical protein
MNKLDKAQEIITAAQQWVKDPDLQNQIDKFFGREPSNKTVSITLNDKSCELGICAPFGANVRGRLAPEQSGYSLYREAKGSTPDQALNDSMRVFDGDVIYSVPPCMGA